MGYATGGWIGSTCTGAVEMGGLKSGSSFTFATARGSFFDKCITNGPNAILGIAGRSGQAKGLELKPTLLDSIATENRISRVFSLQCCGIGRGLNSGSLDIGGVDSSKHAGALAYTPIGATTGPLTRGHYYVSVESVGVRGGTITRRNYDIAMQNLVADFGFPKSAHVPNVTVVDSGTRKLVLEPSLLGPVMDRLPPSAFRQCSQLCSADGQRCAAEYVCTCVTDLAGFPTLTVRLAGGVALELEPRHYMRRCGGDGGAGGCYLSAAIAASDDPTGRAPFNILGQVVLEAYYTVFDAPNARVGFAPVVGCPGGGGGGRSSNAAGGSSNMRGGGRPRVRTVPCASRRFEGQAPDYDGECVVFPTEDPMGPAPEAYNRYLQDTCEPETFGEPREGRAF